MADKWELFQNYWQLVDDDSPVTDASLAEDSFIEDAILKAQEEFKKLTDMLAALSSARTKESEELRKIKESVIIAYSYLREGNLISAKAELERFIK